VRTTFDKNEYRVFFYIEREQVVVVHSTMVLVHGIHKKTLSAPFIGIGPTLFVNVNPVQSTWGFLLLDVHIGFMGFAHGGPHFGPPAPVH